MSERDDSLVGNAADPEQVKYANRKTRRRAERLKNDMRAALAVPACRRVFFRLMYEARTGLSHALELEPHLTASVWDPSSRIHYNAGRQDMGHLLQGWIRQVDPSVLVSMLQEQITLEDQDRAENRASRTPATTERGPDL